MALTRSQQEAFWAYQEGVNLFITGKGGSGKSFLTSQIVASADHEGKNVLVCAPTGLAALNVGGVTINRQFRVAPGLITPDDSAKIVESLVEDYTERVLKDKRKDRGRKNIMDVLVKTDVIVIDEISMCRCDLFTHVGNAIIAANQLKIKVNERNKKRDKKKDKTLSPIQLIVVGDFYQLPPILTDRESAAFHAFYKSVFAFRSPMWRQLGIKTIELSESMRQKDQRFLRCLDSIREGDHPQLDVLKECRSRSDVKAITLCGTNKQAHSINASQLARLKGEEVEYKATVSGKVEAGDWQCDPILKLKVGARVIMLSNDKDGRWINGSPASIRELHDDNIVISLDDDDNAKTAIVERYTWSIEEVSVVESKDKEGKVTKDLKSIVKAKIVQFPMKLSWAISIHKSQGQTFENLNVNIDNIFCEGQLYVALSRCKSLRGLHITGDVTEDKVMVSDEVKEFMANPYGNEEEEEKEVEQDLRADVKTNSSENDKSEYQQGWRDGYDFRSKEVEEEKEQENSPEYILSRINASKLSSEDLASVGLRRVPDRTRREQEKESLPPEDRNPRGAGRPSQGHDQKALKVPVEIIETMRDLVKLYWDHKDAIRSSLERIISGYLN